MNKSTKVSIKLLLLTFTFLLLPFNFSLVYATATQECRFHAAYFDVVFTDNYGSSTEDIYTSDVAARVNVIVQLDSIL